MDPTDSRNFPDLPQPPEVEKRLRLTLAQKVGMPILFLIVLLALFGILDVASDQETIQSEEVEVTVNYPTRLGYQHPYELEIHVQNLQATPFPTVTVGVDAHYLAAFSEVRFTPSADKVTDEWFEVQLTEVEPGRIYQLLVSVRGDYLGQQEGRIRVQPEGAEPLELLLSTFVYP